jgi:hypothetical protein
VRTSASSYNDAYLPLLGNKHPALMQPGTAVWAEIWDIIGPMLDSVMRSGQATWSEDLLLPGLRLIASPLLAPVLAISGLSDVTSVRDA